MFYPSSDADASVFRTACLLFVQYSYTCIQFSINIMIALIYALWYSNPLVLSLYKFLIRQMQKKTNYLGLKQIIQVFVKTAVYIYCFVQAFEFALYILPLCNDHIKINLLLGIYNKHIQQYKQAFTTTITFEMLNINQRRC